MQPRKGHVKARIRTLVKLLKKGVSKKEIAALMQISIASVAQHSRRLGYVDPKRQERGRAAQALLNTPSTRAANPHS